MGYSSSIQKHLLIASAVPHRIEALSIEYACVSEVDKLSDLKPALSLDSDPSPNTIAATLCHRWILEYYSHISICKILAKHLAKRRKRLGANSMMECMRQIAARLQQFDMQGSHISPKK
ncbi:hypothetical protein OIU85_007151 [Salix viminalis]|uniref:Uncharacterized protein n=1 Tax=Salix viminalis TaxID=40686 RepID=A0A9Q0P8K7_SALVM|nr:hypothetical protein OIU85_007151 [Salix viminalis]